jgi:hypothetical protein
MIMAEGKGRFSRLNVIFKRANAKEANQAGKLAGDGAGEASKLT